MRLYFAGGGWWECLEDVVGPEGPGALLSYWDIAATGTPEHPWVEYLGTILGAPLFLDSGAFSAATQGGQVDLRRFITYCQETRGRWDLIASLDVIGDWEQSRANHVVMWAEGIGSIPTFHTLEPFDWLDEMSSEYPYIALGGMVGRGGVALTKWLQDCWSVLRGRDVKVHGFGLSRQRLVFGFPWTSLDSTSWLASKYARVQTKDRGAWGSRWTRAKKRDGVFINGRLTSRLAESSVPPSGATKEEYRISVRASAVGLKEMVAEASRMHDSGHL